MDKKCTRPSCLFIRHNNPNNNGGTHCCHACKTQNSHGPLCQRIIFDEDKYCYRLKIWYDESYEEKNIKLNLPKHSCSNLFDYSYINKAYAIYPKRFYEKVNNYHALLSEKKYDFVFIGGLNTDMLTAQARQWITPFIRTYFNENSYLQFTDKQTKQNGVSFGSFDYTHLKSGLIPKQMPINFKATFDENYFKIMCQSKFCLCPAGDVPWSMRLYEALLCKAIPIVHKEKESYRSIEESKLGYKFYLTTDKEFVYRLDWVEHNYNLFMKYHTLEYLDTKSS
jgi:hypothetical protein